MNLRNEIRAAVARGDDEAVAAWADRKKNLLSLLFGLTFDADPHLAWQAVRASGIAARRLAETDPEKVRDHMRRLSWSLNDESGGIGWRAPETMGEIVFQCPKACRNFLPLMVFLLNMEAQDRERFLPGILWALGRLGPVLPPAGREGARSQILPLLSDPDSQIRGLAVWALAALGGETPPGIERLAADDAAVTIFEDGKLQQTTVGRLAGRMASCAAPGESL